MQKRCSFITFSVAVVLAGGPRHSEAAAIKGTISQLPDPHKSTTMADCFGQTVTPIPAKNTVVVTAPCDSTVAQGAGAVYLFNAKTKKIISTLYGNFAGDAIGSGGVVVVGAGNAVILSPSWHDNHGAATWIAGAAGLSGTVSATNSLVGYYANDMVGFGGVTVLSNGNYVVGSPSWNDGDGAATWGSGAGGVVGTISSSNSLVGAAIPGLSGPGSGYATGRVITALAKGNYVVTSPLYATAAFSSSSGAITWGNGATGTTGVVTPTNSLVSNGEGAIGGTSYGGVYLSGVVPLANGNYVVASANWESQSLRGAATFELGTRPATGSVGPSNSLIGLLPVNGGITVPGVTVTALSNGNYVVAAPDFGATTQTITGAVAWGNGKSGTIGTLSSANALVGDMNNDGVGKPAGTLFSESLKEYNNETPVVPLTNGNYVVVTPAWHNSTGAVTWGSGVTGIHGVISSSNSLVGQNDAATGFADKVGIGGVAALTDGNYVVSSPYWSAGQGAATWLAGTAATSEVITSANSFIGLAGGNTGDEVGLAGIYALKVNPAAPTAGGYVILSPSWGNSLGAATFATGKLVGMPSATNSLVGATSGSTGDSVGSDGVVPLANGSYVVLSSLFDFERGATTWGSASKGVTGVVSSKNSQTPVCGGTTSTGNNTFIDAFGLRSSNYVIETLSNYVLASGTGGLAGACPTAGDLQGQYFWGAGGFGEIYASSPALFSGESGTVSVFRPK